MQYIALQSSTLKCDTVENAYHYNENHSNRIVVCIGDRAVCCHYVVYLARIEIF